MQALFGIVDFNFILAIGVGMARIYPCTFLIPAFSFEYLKGLPRHAIVFALALIPAPGIKEVLSVEHYGVLFVAGMAAKELLLGALIGILLALPFWLFESVGALFDSQRGALLGGQINPNYGPSDTPSGRLFRDITVYLLVITLGFHGLVQLIWDSYRLWPPSLWFPQLTDDGFHVFLSALNDTFSDIVLYAAPFVCVLLLIDFGMGIMTLFSPQLNVFVLSGPLKSVIGFAFLLVYLPTLLELIQGQLDRLPELPAILGQLLQDPRGGVP